MGKGDSRLHARTQADADTMAAKWAATFKTPQVIDHDMPPDIVMLMEEGGRMVFKAASERALAALTDAERDAMWRAGPHIQRGRTDD